MATAFLRKAFDHHRCFYPTTLLLVASIVTAAIPVFTAFQT